MEQFLHYLQLTGVGAGHVAIWLLCIAGVAISVVSLSGTWLVTVATILAAWLSGPEFPGIWTILGFTAISGGVEVLEGLAGTWGVRKRGGSAWAGLAALVGGILGLFLGSLIPILIIGNLLGMIIGSFGLSYAVEHYRLKKAAQAAHIAWGAVIARLLVVFLKVMTTLGMSVFLLIGFYL